MTIEISSYSTLNRNCSFKCTDTINICESIVTLTNSFSENWIWFRSTSFTIITDNEAFTETLIVAWRKSWETNTVSSIPVRINNRNTSINGSNSTLDSIKESTLWTETSSNCILLSRCTSNTLNTIPESSIRANTLRLFIIPNSSFITRLIWNTSNTIIIWSWWASVRSW